MSGKPVLLLADDGLLFPSRIREAARPLGYELRVAGLADKAREAARAEPPPAAILVNLAARRFDPDALIRDLKSDAATRDIPLLAFAGHLETARHAAARAAGADRIVANSSVSLHLPKLLARLVSGAPADDLEDDLEEDAPQAQA